MLYKYIDVEGVVKTIQQKNIKFSKAVNWSGNANIQPEGNDVNENFILSCVTSEEQFNKAVEHLRKNGFTDGKIKGCLYMLCLYAYQTYISCFVEIRDNKKYMFDEYTRNGGACIVFENELYNVLRNRYESTKINNPNKDLDVYKFEIGKIIYLDELPSLELVMDSIEEHEKYKKLAYFSKLKERWEIEQETRMIITSLGLKEAFISLFIPYANGYNCSYAGLRDFMLKMMDIDLSDRQDKFLKYDDYDLINKVYLSPHNTMKDNEEISCLCNDYGISCESYINLL